MTNLTPDDGSAPSTSDRSADQAALRESGARSALESEREALDAQLVDIGADDAPSAFDDNFADSGQVAAEQGENRALAAQLREQLDDVERALARLDDGTYGRCEVCDEPIGDDRLDAMPAARLCMAHAT